MASLSSAELAQTVVKVKSEQYRWLKAGFYDMTLILCNYGAEYADLAGLWSPI